MFTLGSRTTFNCRTSSQLAPAPAARAISGQLKPLMAPNPGAEQICRRFSAGSCPNHFSSCRTNAGIKLIHVCDAPNALGQPCTKFHSGAQHH
jgi:hypothetical protein